MLNTFIFLMLLVFCDVICAQDSLQFTDLYGDYLGMPLPGDTPVVFAPGIVSTDDLEHSPAVFSPDGNQLFWNVRRPPGPNNKDWLRWDKTMQRIGGRWTKPTVSVQAVPIFSHDGKRQYYGAPKKEPYYIEKIGNDWSEPRYLNLLDKYPELKYVGLCSVAENNTIYFMSNAAGLGTHHNFGIYRAEFLNGKYTKPELLPRSINLPPFLNWIPLIAPDESYVIFSSNRHDSNDGGDLYISFRDENADTWMKPVNMGEAINTSAQERCPGLSPDGKYLFFTRWTRDHNHDIFWVSTKVIDKLKEKYDIKK
jgi:hypothetical protein